MNYSNNNSNGSDKNHRDIKSTDKKKRKNFVNGSTESLDLGMKDWLQNVKTENNNGMFTSNLFKNDVTQNKQKQKIFIGEPVSVFAPHGEFLERSRAMKKSNHLANQICDEINPENKKMKDQIYRNTVRTYKGDSEQEYENFAYADEEMFRRARAAMPSDQHLFYKGKDANTEQNFVLPRDFYSSEGKSKKKPKTPAPKKKQKIRICSNCRTTTTPSWRRGGNNRVLLCNACGLYLKLHGRHRPFAINAEGKTKALKGASGDLICVVCNVHGDVSNMIATVNGMTCYGCSAYFNRQIAENGIQIDPSYNYNNNYPRNQPRNIYDGYQYNDEFGYQNMQHNEFYDPTAFYYPNEIEDNLEQQMEVSIKDEENYAEKSKDNAEKSGKQQ